VSVVSKASRVNVDFRALQVSTELSAPSDLLDLPVLLAPKVPLVLLVLAALLVLLVLLGLGFNASQLWIHPSRLC
jgi:hypothetical protein